LQSSITTPLFFHRSEEQDNLSLDGITPPIGYGNEKLFRPIFFSRAAARRKHQNRTLTKLVRRVEIVTPANTFITGRNHRFTPPGHYVI
jgi:hypothetical protein